MKKRKQAAKGNKNRRSKGKKIGGTFERNVCKLFSMWWSNGIRDDIFWRTASSGGRATQRSIKDKTTFGQYGDIQATDPIGQSLIDLFVIELKKNYNKESLYDMLDKPKPTSIYFEWITKLKEEVCCGHAPFWMLIHKRCYRETIVVLPNKLYSKIKIPPTRRVRVMEDRTGQRIACTAMLLEDFFRYVRPNQIKRWAKQRS